jgi:class III poly(R)-hydroxyalkanoic acid synthase PhaE subunit
MDIAADLFLQMMKGIYPGNKNESTEKYRKWFHKGGFAMDSEIQSKVTQRIIENGNLYVKFMNAVLEATQATYAKEGSDEKLNEIYNKISQHLLEFYQENMGKYLDTPQFGIQREPLQQINSAISAYHKFLGAAGDFLVMFSTPLKKSMDNLQQAIKDRERTNEGFKSAKEVYNFAVNILDEAYDDWLKSPEGVHSVVNMVGKYLDYRKKLNPLKDSWFKSLSIPTKREMEDVYRGIYDLKKKTRQQDAMIREQNEIIKTLTRKLKTIERLLK